MGRCCDYCDLRRPDDYPDPWSGPGHFRIPGCVGLVPQERGDSGSSADYHTNPHHPRGWWVPIPPLSVALLPPTNTRTEKVLYRRSTGSLDVQIKLVRDTDLIVEDQPKGPAREKLEKSLEATSAGTPIDFPTWTFYESTRRFKWRGSIVVRTVYRRRGMAGSYSCYGRGTTAQDVLDGKVTLGFHEWCHQEFFEKFLVDHPFPLPRLTPGMSVDDFRKEKLRFETAAGEYSRKIVAENEKAADEVGHKKATWLATRACFRHTLPLK